MPRGGGSRGHKSGHKGQRRHFTSPEELEAMKEKEERERQWREQRGDESSDEEKEEDGKSQSGDEAPPAAEEGTKKPTNEADQPVDMENPNRVVNKAKKVSQIDLEDDSKPELSRKEREEIERQKARANYLKLHAEGKTEEARADLARLAIIKKQREEAAKKRDDERKAREAAKAAKTDSLNKALGKGRKT